MQNGDTEEQPNPPKNHHYERSPPGIGRFRATFNALAACDTESLELRTLLSYRALKSLRTCSDVEGFIKYCLGNFRELYEEPSSQKRALQFRSNVAKLFHCVPESYRNVRIAPSEKYSSKTADSTLSARMNRYKYVYPLLRPFAEDSKFYSKNVIGDYCEALKSKVHSEEESIIEHDGQKKENLSSDVQIIKTQMEYVLSFIRIGRSKSEVYDLEDLEDAIYDEIELFFKNNEPIIPDKDKLVINPLLGVKESKRYQTPDQEFEIETTFESNRRTGPEMVLAVQNKNTSDSDIGDHSSVFTFIDLKEHIPLSLSAGTHNSLRILRINLEKVIVDDKFSKDGRDRDFLEFFTRITVYLMDYNITDCIISDGATAYHFQLDEEGFRKLVTSQEEARANGEIDDDLTLPADIQFSDGAMTIFFHLRSSLRKRVNRFDERMFRIKNALEEGFDPYFEEQQVQLAINLLKFKSHGLPVETLDEVTTIPFFYSAYKENSERLPLQIIITAIARTILQDHQRDNKRDTGLFEILRKRTIKALNREGIAGDFDQVIPSTDGIARFPTGNSLVGVNEDKAFKVSLGDIGTPLQYGTRDKSQVFLVEKETMLKYFRDLRGVSLPDRMVLKIYEDHYHEVRFFNRNRDASNQKLGKIEHVLSYTKFPNECETHRLINKRNIGYKLLAPSECINAPTLFACGDMVFVDSDNTLQFSGPFLLMSYPKPDQQQIHDFDDATRMRFTLELHSELTKLKWIGVLKNESNETSRNNIISGGKLHLIDFERTQPVHLSLLRENLLSKIYQPSPFSDI